MPQDDDFLRLAVFDAAASRQGLLMPGRDPLVFWFEPHPLQRRERELRAESEKATSKLMKSAMKPHFVGIAL